jgi:hypothetical protein
MSKNFKTIKFTHIFSLLYEKKFSNNPKYTTFKKLELGIGIEEAMAGISIPASSISPVPEQKCRTSFALLPHWFRHR